MLLVPLPHHAIARDFCNDARRRNAETDAIASDERGVRIRERTHRQTVDQDVIRREPRCRLAHAFVRRAKDVQSVDFRRFDADDRPENVLPRADFLVERLALFLAELLGVVENFVPKFERQNHRRDDYWPSEGTATGFVHSGDSGVTERTQLVFMLQRTAHG